MKNLLYSLLTLTASAAPSLIQAGDGKATVQQSAAFVDEGPAWDVTLGASLREVEVSFSTAGIPSLNAAAYAESDDELLVSPGIELGRTISKSDGLTIRLGLGYSFATFDSHTSGFDGEFVAGESADERYTVDASRFDGDIHQIHAGVTFSKRVTESFEIGLSFGPMLIITDGDFRGTQEIFQEVPGQFGTFTAGSRADDSGTQTSFGAYGEVRARVDLSETVFIEASGGYQWAETQSYGSSRISAEIDPKSWTAALKVGFRF